MLTGALLTTDPSDVPAASRDSDLRTRTFDLVMSVILGWDTLAFPCRYGG
jgi:hypothetical protein